MNRLQEISKQQAKEILQEYFSTVIRNLMYYSWPCVYPNTSGPFSKPGMISGQAFTEFQIECWTDGSHTLVFCRGQELAVIEEASPFDIGRYINKRGGW